MESENNMKIKIGARIKFLRNGLGITQEQLANKLPNVKGKSSIANYENGSNLPSDEVKLKMCEIFNCSLDYLMCKSDIRNPGKQIDDVLNEAMIGMSKEEYEALNETQKKQIRDFALFVKKQNEGDKNGKQK